MKTDTISAALRRLDMSDSEQAIYLSLLREGRATARLLADRTGLTRPSVYDQLKKLIALNLVVELDVEGKAYFAAGEVKHLDALLGDRIDRLEQSRQFLLEALPDIEAGLDTVTPKIRFFEGEDGMKQLMKDLMWHDGTTVEATWNDVEIKKIYDSAFLRWWNERRTTRKIKITWLCLKGTKKTDTADFYNPALDTIVLSAHTKAPLMTRLVYANKVACISSQKEAFGFIVESAEFKKLQAMF
ncbi:MAG: winged helix-turn-helix transcriptional regulator [Candidatus Pacebacteria bacterium]|jgi:sugar-specific transcriptional regulator TrmB|nr:winged helix-turn-helix transcriptional regulator [Candidatus Paceibacterota bacterium]